MSEATVIALGFFDGVHLGHGALLRKTAERARELGVTPAAFTFDRSPKEFVTGVPVPLLTSAAERAEIIREYYGIGTVFVEPFDRAMMTMPWEDFITELLVKKYRAVHLVAGHPPERECGIERAEGFRARLAKDPMDAGADAAVALSVSIGVAAFHPQRHHDADALYHAADSALYVAKAAGRNRVANEGDVASPSR